MSCAPRWLPARFTSTPTYPALMRVMRTTLVRRIHPMMITPAIAITRRRFFRLIPLNLSSLILRMSRLKIVVVIEISFLLRACAENARAAACLGGNLAAVALCSVSLWSPDRGDHGGDNDQ